MMNKKKIDHMVEARVQQRLAMLNSYANYEADLGFLTLLITRHINCVKYYVIDPLNTKLQKNDYLRDEDFSEIHNQITASIMMDLSDSYKNMLCTKYFKDETRLIKFIDDNVLFTMQTLAISTNNQRIASTYKEAFNTSILNLNAKPKEEK